MQIEYHVLLLFVPVVCGNSTHKREWQMSLSQLDCTYTHANLRLKHTWAVCMAVRLCFEGRKDKGEA